MNGEKFDLKKLLRSILAIALAATMILGCVAMLSGCQDGSGNGEGDGDNKTTEPGNKNDWYNENMSDKEYMQGLYKNQISDMIDGLTSVYGALGSLNPDAALEMSANSSVSIQVGDMIIDMLEDSYESSTGSSMDFGFLSKVGLDMNVAMNGDLMKNEMALLLSGKKIATVSMLMNMSQSIMYLAVPELNDDFIKVDMGDAGVAAPSVAGMVGQISEIMQVLPSEEQLNTLLTRYVGIVLENLKNVERTTTTLELDGLKQDVTALSVKVYEEDAYAVVKAVLTAALEDKELEKALEGVSELAGTDLYPQLKEEIEYILEDMEGAEEDFDTENYIELITYTDSDHNIVGHELNMPDDGRGAIHYYTVTDGNAFAFEAVIEDADFAITGSGTNKSGTIDAEYILTDHGIDYVVLEVEGWKATAQTVKGTLRIEPTAELIDAMFGSADGLPFADIALEIKLDNESIELNLLGNDALVVGIVVESKEASGGSIKEPSNYVDAMDSEQMQQWLEDMKFDTILRNLRNAGVPSDLVDMLEQAIDSAMNGGAYEEYPEPDYEWEY